MKKRESILVVEDSPTEREALVRLLGDRYETIQASSGREAHRLLRGRSVDLVLLDIVMEDLDGLTLLRLIKKDDKGTPVVMMSSITKIATVVECMKLGAYNYVTKPINRDELLLCLAKALEERRKDKELLYLRSRYADREKPSEFIGRSPAAREILETVRKVSRSGSNVLITGESGTGKELLARLIHRSSSCADGPFVPIHCGAIPAELFESELFGHEKGAFTGAVALKVGRIELADSGTLFLDEIATMPMSLQIKLLRVLEEREVMRVGGSKMVPVTFRLITATNRDIKEAAAEGSFREDLFYRINVVHLHIPPLRERREDISPLAVHLIKKHSEFKRITAEALEALEPYEWKGNVRELENVIERAALLAEDNEIRTEHLHLGRTDSALPPADLDIPDGFGLRQKLEDAEKAFIAKALRQARGKRERAARILGIHRNTLARRIAYFGLGEE